MRIFCPILTICIFPCLKIHAIVPDSYEIFLNPHYDIYNLKHPHVEEKINLKKYEQVTVSKKGCACWFDPLEKFMKKGACACCKSGKNDVTKNGVQCGYPMHNWCQPQVEYGEEQIGCKGTLWY